MDGRGLIKKTGAKNIRSTITNDSDDISQPTSYKIIHCHVVYKSKTTNMLNIQNYKVIFHKCNVGRISIELITMVFAKVLLTTNNLKNIKH